MIGGRLSLTGAAAGVPRLGYAQPLAAGDKAVPPNGLLRMSALRLAFRVLDADDGLVTAVSDAGDAAAVLRRLLAAVEAGDLDAAGPKAARVVRQLYGAAVALEAVAGSVGTTAAREEGSDQRRR